MAAGFPQSEPRSEQDREAQGISHTTLYNLTLELTAHDFCHVLFISKKSRGPAHTRRGVITKGCNYQETEIIGAIVEAA